MLFEFWKGHIILPREHLEHIIERTERKFNSVRPCCSWEVVMAIWYHSSFLRVCGLGDREQMGWHTNRRRVG